MSQCVTVWLASQWQGTLYARPDTDLPVWLASHLPGTCQSHHYTLHTTTHCTLPQCVKVSTVCCSVLQCVAVCCSVLQCVAVCCSVLQCDAVCCSVMQCVAVCCSSYPLHTLPTTHSNPLHTTTMCESLYLLSPAPRCDFTYTRRNGLHLRDHSGRFWKDNRQVCCEALTVLIGARIFFDLCLVRKSQLNSLFM